MSDSEDDSFDANELPFSNTEDEEEFSFSDESELPSTGRRNQQSEEEYEDSSSESLQKGARTKRKLIAKDNENSFIQGIVVTLIVSPI